MIESIFRWLFSEPAPQHNEIELRNAIIGALTEHLNRLGHPVEAVRIPSHAMPNRDGSAFTNTFFGASNLRLIAGLDAFGNNVITGRTASATVTSSKFGAPVGDAPIGVGTLAGVPASANLAVRASATLPPTLAAAERDYGRPSSALSPSWAAPERAVTRADLSATLRDADRAWSEYLAAKQGAK